MRLLLAIVAVLPAAAADMCPAGGQPVSGAVAGALEWNSRSVEVRKRQCISTSLRNMSGAPVEAAWPDAGVDRALIGDRLEIATCCFDGAARTRSKIRYGSPMREIAAEVWAESGEDSDAEGFPDLIENEARERTLTIRGTLSADGAPLRVDLLLKCSASRFADRYAYQFTVINRSLDPVNIDWDLLRRVRDKLSASTQPVPGGTAYVFLSAVIPSEAVGVIELKSKSGALAGRFHADGFTLSTNAH
ncbi:MAG TPA: hypothetical protein VGF59_24330 [Bryobacteraceae bacterium]|jgi:hypothetical protein